MSLRPLQFEFASCAKRRQRRFAAAALSLAGLMLVLSGERLVVAWQTLEEARNRVVKDDANASNVMPILTPEQSEARQRVRTEVARIAERQGIPWAELLNTFDQSVDPDVALLSVEPDVAQRSVHVQAEARNAEAAGRFVKRLEQTKVLQHAHIVEHSYMVQEGIRPIRIVVQAYWHIGPDVPPVDQASRDLRP